MLSSASPFGLTTAVLSLPPSSNVQHSICSSPVRTGTIATFSSPYLHFIHRRRTNNDIQQTLYSHRRPILTANSQLNYPLVSPDDTWGIWTALLGTGAIGLWLEKTKMGSMVSGALVSILVGLAASNLGIIPYESPAYSIVMKYLLPLSIPLLLFRADMKTIFRTTGTLFFAFLLGSVATIIGTLVAFLVVPMRSLGQDNWKIASALMGSYIGGAINYIAISEALGVSSSVIAAGVAADNVICAIYFIGLFGLAHKIPSEASTVENDLSKDAEASSSRSNVQALRIGAALAVSLAICKSGTFLSEILKIKGGDLPAITAIIVILATMLPRYFQHLSSSGDAMAMVLMQVFFGALGAGGSIWNVISTSPSILMFAFIQVSVHLMVIIGVGKVVHLDTKLLLLASNANIGGPTTACGMAKAKGWDSLIVPGILVGIFGISIATFIGIGFGMLLLRHL